MHVCNIKDHKNVFILSITICTYAVINSQFISDQHENINEYRFPWLQASKYGQYVLKVKYFMSKKLVRDIGNMESIVFIKEGFLVAHKMTRSPFCAPSQIDVIFAKVHIFKSF